MTIIENNIGWEDLESGLQVAYNEEWSIMNCCRNPKFKLPIWKKRFPKGEEGVSK